ncbi:MAG: type II toxin-antitoxin system VapC family toxin [Sporichthyaceae bacterium]
MSRTLYVDTGAFIALLYARDDAHAAVSAHARELRAERALLITSDAVISETVTRLRYDAGLPAVRGFRTLLDQATEQRTLIIRDGDTKARAAAFEVMERYADLMLSFADAIGAVIATERKTDAVFGLDNDFRVMGFALEP